MHLDLFFLLEALTAGLEMGLFARPGFLRSAGSLVELAKARESKAQCKPLGVCIARFFISELF